MTSEATDSITEHENLQEYKDSIAFFLKYEIEMFIPNSNSKHALAIYEQFLTSAQSSINIFCKNMHKKVFTSEILRLFKEALGRGVKIKAVIQESKMDCSEDYNELKDYPNFELRQADKIDAESTYNFVVLDNHSYRYETNREEQKGILGIHSPKNVKKLSNLFIDIFNSATPITA